MKQTFLLTHDEARRRAWQAVSKAPQGYAVTIGEPTRNLEQNAAMWPILEAYAERKQISVNGAMVNLSPEEWKDILTGAFREEAPRVAHYRGRVVLVGQRTSGFSKSEFSEWLDWLMATAHEDEVLHEEMGT